jgi:hypothetical protein
MRLGLLLLVIVAGLLIWILLGGKNCGCWSWGAWRCARAAHSVVWTRFSWRHTKSGGFA